MREDLKLAAYAVSIGWTLGIQGCSNGKDFNASRFDQHGVPQDSLSFERGPWFIWNTARGWRASRMIGKTFEMATDRMFHITLLRALKYAEKEGGPWVKPREPARTVMLSTLDEIQVECGSKARGYRTSNERLQLAFERAALYASNARTFVQAALMAEDTMIASVPLRINHSA